MDRKTIAAVATPPGEGAVGVLRLSGNEALAVAGRVFRSLHGKKSLKSAPDRVLLHGVAQDPRDGAPVDEVLAAVFRGPHSYTGEDVVEFYCHGGRLVVERMLKALEAAGARPAAPGEFTWRAFFNGRLDLAQAEAVIDVVRARSEEGLRCAVSGLLGALSERVGRLKEELVGTLAHLEAALDFPDEEVPELAWPEIVARLRRVEEDVAGLLAGAGRGRLLREGLRAVLVGRPNVGKSSLLNALVGRERAIVTPVPGTTRDVIEENVVLDGVPVCLVDTAGLRAARNAVEREGVRRARGAAREANVTILVLDGSVALQAGDREAAAHLGKYISVVALNKADRARTATGDEAVALLPGRPCVWVSARTGEGLPELERAVVRAGQGRPVAVPPGGGEGRQDVVVTRARHEEALARAGRQVAAAVREASRSRREELVAARVREALHALGEITGENVDEDVIKAIFATFCVGK